MRGEAGLPKYSAMVRKHAGIAQLGERQTEDLKVAGSIPAVGNIFFPSSAAVCRAAVVAGCGADRQLGRVVKAID